MPSRVLTPSVPTVTMSLPVFPLGQGMGQPTYFKRYRMELDLRRHRPPAELPRGFHWMPWHPSVLEAHAQVKFRCFQGETDTVVFPSLGHLAGCRDLMTAIVHSPRILPRRDLAGRCRQ